MIEASDTPPPTNLVAQQKKERERIGLATQREPEWWPTAAETGQLVPMPDQGENYRLIGPIRRREESNLARPETREFLELVQQQWRSKLSEQGALTENIRLAVTSLYRDQRFQDHLVETNPRAPRGFSAHQAGAAVDLDPGGYYQGVEAQPIDRTHPDFNPCYLKVLKQVLSELMGQGKCNFVPEKGYRLNDSGEIEEYEACYHVCVNPNAN